MNTHTVPAIDKLNRKTLKQSMYAWIVRLRQLVWTTDVQPVSTDASKVREEMICSLPLEEKLRLGLYRYMD